MTISTVKIVGVIATLGLWTALAVATVDHSYASSTPEATSSAVAGCPPNKALDNTPVMRQCSGNHPVDCLRRPAGDTVQTHLCGYPNGRSWVRIWTGWGCGLESQDCFPAPCRRAQAIGLAFKGTVYDIVHDVPIPIAGPAEAAGTMVVERLVSNAVAQRFGLRSESATQNVSLTCGRATRSTYADNYDNVGTSSSLHLSITFGKQLVLGKAGEYADLIERALSLHTDRADGFSSSMTFSFRGTLNGKTRTIKAKMSFSLTGGFSLTIT